MFCDKSLATETRITLALRMLNRYLHCPQLSRTSLSQFYIKLSPPLPQFADP